MNERIQRLNWDRFKQFSAFLMLGLLFAEPSLAAANNMPWEGPIQNLLNSITGPVARAAGVIAITGMGLYLAFSEGGGAMRKALGIVFGLSIAFAAAQWGLVFFGFAGGLAV